MSVARPSLIISTMSTTHRELFDQKGHYNLTAECPREPHTAFVFILSHREETGLQ
jgi:hypothetical protein